MSKATDIMNSNLSNQEKLDVMVKHWDSIEKWIDSNELTQTKYSQDELAEMIKEILDSTIELKRRVNW